MSTAGPKTVSRKKRTTEESGANASSPAPLGDHRKRRRNRTTQSCLNCHTSKRMCDRKRPCGRCTQLGLTGLCVYEVDDPSQRTDLQDEGSRLRKRVAELEGVIRELKNKPHPRWVQAGSTPEVEFEKWHAHSQSRPVADQQQTEHGNESNSTSSSNSSPSSGSMDGSQLTSQVTSPHTHPAQTSSPELSIPPPYSPYFRGVSSPISTPSPSLMTPTDEYMGTQALIAGEQPLAGEFDFASMLMSYPDLLGCGDSLEHNALGGNVVTDHLNDTCTSEHLHTSAEDYCGCLTEGSSYNAMLELSLRLRKSADTLGRSPYHSFGSHHCALHQRIIELDTLATTKLGNITTPPSDISQISPSHPLCHKLTSSSSTCYSTSCHSRSASTVSPQTLQGILTWEATSSVPEPSPICEDSFMSWEPSRRS